MRERFNLGDLIDRGGDLEKAAIIDLGGEVHPRTVSFVELDAMCAAVARGLLRRGLVRGDRIAILSNNRTEYLAACLGAMQAGVVAVPINHRFPAELSDFVLRDSGARIVFCDAEHVPSCPAGMPVVVFGSSVPPSAGMTGPPRFDEFLDAGPFDAIHPSLDESAMFLYTSGSTGLPKGVMLSHRSHLWVVKTRMGSLDLARHRYLIAAPLYHMNALALSMLTIAAGATMVLLPQFSSRTYIDAIERYRCTWLTAVPPMIAMMLRETELVAHTDFSSVELLRMGSAPVSPKLLDAIHHIMPHTTVINAYGTTEGGPVVFGAHPDGLKQPVLSVGYPHPQVQLRLRPDVDVSADDQGVLELKSPGLMTGYHNRSDLKPPFSDDGFYKTGDVFHRDGDGFYYFVGRSDDMFVCGGENVYPSEVERLLESHPDIVQACVVAIDDEIKGQKPVAFCVLRNGAKRTEAEVKRFTLEHGPAYRHPRFVWFLDRLPLASTNKVDRKALRQRASMAATFS